MYNQQIVNINDYDELKPEFFNSMFEAELKYYKTRDEQSMKELLCFYTDCISYFEIKQESISEYFQQKIKELVREIKQFGTQQLAVKNREKMNKNVIRVMQEENIQAQITSSIKKQQKVNEAVNRIIQQQNQKLERRLLKTKRTMSKCFSATMSLASIDSSPDLKPLKAREPLKLKSKLLFTKQIYSDEENSTS